ncbi:hypothetical protein DFH11DRAFT_1604724, partial [Phellopilus nigrolimitatus]
MVSADNLHFDILGLIFAYLSGSDLVSVSLVSRAFLNSVTPRLYHALVFTHFHAKRYPKTVTPFASLLKRPFLAVHVQVCDISSLPLHKGQPNQAFLSDCTKALEICVNITKFRLTPNVLPNFLETLSKKTNLKDLQVNASITTEQAEILTSLQGLRSIRLVHCSWCLMNLFPRWISVLSPTLTHLTLTLTPDLNEVILERILIQLPGLLSLHIRNCMKLEHAVVFRLLAHTPLLENLAVSVYENATTDTSSFAELKNLRLLHLDTHNVFSTATAYNIWSNIIAHTKSTHAPLSILTLQLSGKLVLSDTIVDEILDAHADTLTMLRFVRCGVGVSKLREICSRCGKLEKLAVHVPVKELNSFVGAIGESRSLKLLVDEREVQTPSGRRASLNHEDVRALMAVSPKLRTIISDSRSWKGSGDVENLRITLERLKTSSFPNVMSFP